MYTERGTGIMRFTIFTGRNFKGNCERPYEYSHVSWFSVLLIGALALMKESIGGMADVFEVQNFCTEYDYFRHGIFEYICRYFDVHR